MNPTSYWWCWTQMGQIPFVQGAQKDRKLTSGPLVTKSGLLVTLMVGIRDQREDQRYFLGGRLCLVS